MDYFQVFGLPRKLQIDGEELRRRFYELSRRVHPDYYQTGTAGEQAGSLERSALVNRAYRALRDLVPRVEYLIRLEEGRDTREGGKAKPAPPVDLLEEMLEVQEMLAAARGRGLSGPERGRLGGERDRLVARRQKEEEGLLALARRWDAAVDGVDRAACAALLTQMKQALAARAYLGTVIGDLNETLGDDTAHVTHRRH